LLCLSLMLSIVAGCGKSQQPNQNSSGNNDRQVKKSKLGSWHIT